jgi:hypothetical protein
MAKVAAHASYSGQRNRTIAAQNQRKRAGFYGLLHARFQRFDCSKYSRQISRARAVVVRFVSLRRIIAKVGDYVTNRI